MKIFKEPIVVIDTETTGFHKEAEVIEIGAVCLDEWGRERSTFSALIKPNVTNDWRVQKALAVSNITVEQLQQCSPLEEVRPQFLSWMEAIPSTTSLKCVAYNTKFDKRMLDRSGIHLHWGYCLLQMTKELMASRNYVVTGINGQSKAPSLEDACRFLGIDYPQNAHRALEDVRVTALIAAKIFPVWRELAEPLS